ncbi:MAG: DUF3450 domain-containing protein [Desulfobacteraceae bacterium]|nr:DUF3450 domain-containing protein [Desulfobacteraceae bacterium]
MFRLGRLALFRITQDNKLLQLFDKKKKLWVTIPSDNSTELRKAIDITAKKRATTVVDLPIGSLFSLLPQTTPPKNSIKGVQP